MSGPSKFRARVRLSPEHVESKEVWDDYLDPLGPILERHIPVREWVSLHLDEWNREEYTDRRLVPADGCWEILFEGTIRGYRCGPYDEEYDEEVEVTTLQVQRLPDDFWNDVGAFSNCNGIIDNKEPEYDDEQLQR